MIVTFYSYKGGVGRTMTLANVAYILARAGHEVVLVDWDLEAPGLERFFSRPPHGDPAAARFPADVRAIQAAPGLLEMLQEYKQRMTRSPEDLRADLSGDDKRIEPLASLDTYLVELRSVEPLSGKLLLLTAGQRDEEHFRDYAALARSFDWLEFYQRWDGERFFEWLRAALEGADRRRIVLIDSRTGVSEMGNVCTRQLADIVVMLCAPNDQNLDGARRMADTFLNPRLRLLRHNGLLELVVVPARLDTTESQAQKLFTDNFLAVFSGYPTTFDHAYAFDLAIPYVARYAYNERIALGDPELPLPAGRQMVVAYSQLALMICALGSPQAYRQLLEAIRIEDVTFSPTALSHQRHIVALDYLEQVRAEAGRLQLAVSMGASSVDPQFDLAAVYMRQEVTPGIEGGLLRMVPDDSDTRNPLTTAFDLVFGMSYAVLLGDPGAGKTTFAKYLALSLAQSYLRYQQEAVDPEIEVWRDQRLLPLLLPLRELIPRFKRGEEHGAHERLTDPWEWVKQRYGQGPCALLEQSAQAGKVLWLLDGLDETMITGPTPWYQLIVRLISDLTARYPGCRFLVTCRVADYRSPERRLEGGRWNVATLQPFSAKAQAEFITQYLGKLSADRPGIVSVSLLPWQLIGQIELNPGLRRLAGNPLMLAMITLVYVYEGRLPDERTDIYDRCISLLLERWRTPPLEVQMRERLGLPALSSADIEHLLERLAYTAHVEQLKRGSSLPRAAAIDAVEPYLAALVEQMTAVQSRDWAEGVCAAFSDLSNGIFQADGPDSFRFLHLTFQEYLAARRLVSDDDWSGPDEYFVERALGHLRRGTHWFAPVVMACERLARSGQVRAVVDLTSKLIDPPAGHEPQPILAAEMLLAIRRDRFSRLKGYTPLWSRVAEALEHILKEPALQHAELLEIRLRAASLLSHLGDSRPGVASIRPRWCEIPGGPAIIGSDLQDPITFGASLSTDLASLPDEVHRQTIDLATFWISAYPVTNAQWQRFLDDQNGYDSPEWWDERGRAWKESLSGAGREPAFWGDPRFTLANQPVVGVSWYEVRAFCRWLSAQLGHIVRLPSEAEWEKAARGREGLIYPWGQEWAEGLSNTQESGIGQPSPVGVFAAASSASRLYDMAGNVLEWTASPRERVPGTGTLRYESRSEAAGLRTPKMAARGGSWLLPREFARGAARSYHEPGYRQSDLGFRVAADEVDNAEP